MAGVVSASEANLALGALLKIDLVSAGNTDIATGGNEIMLPAGVRITLSAPDNRLVATGVQVDYGSDTINAQSKGKHLN